MERKVIELRNARLQGILNLLGYENHTKIMLPLDDSAGFRCLRRMGEQLENYVNMIPNYNDGIVTSEENEEYKEQLEAQIEEDIQFAEAQEDWIETIRAIPGQYDFLQNMREKVSPSDWELYAKTVRRIAYMFTDLNADLIPKQERRGVHDLTRLRGLHLKDRISELIDSGEFARACHIEDIFVINECDRCIEGIDRFGGENLAGMVELEARKREAQATRAERNDYIRKYQMLDGSIRTAEQQKALERVKKNGERGSYGD